MSAQDPTITNFGNCTRGHRARLVWFDKDGRHQEPYVHMFTVPNIVVYRVTCPTCGEEYTTFDNWVERVTE